MRASLAESLASQHVADVQYPAGSVILCCACLKPLYVLQRSIFSGEKTSRTVDAYRPITLDDLAQLETRIDQAGLAALVRSWSQEARAAHVAVIPDIKTGAAALCPCCARSWVRVRAVDAEEVIDHAYVWELVTVPPRGPVAEQVVRAWVLPPSIH